MNYGIQTAVILALVFVGALRMSRGVVLLAAAWYEVRRSNRRELPAFRRIAPRHRIYSIPDIADLLVRGEWIRQPMRRPTGRLA